MFILLMSTCYMPVMAQEESKDVPEVFLTPSALVADVYKAVSYEVGNPPDWDYVRSHFHPDAVVVLRVTREETKKFNVDGFIQDFVNFVAQIDPNKNDFKEEVVSLKVLEFGNIAHCYVVYKASIPTSGRPGQLGLDSWQLMKKDGRWWAVSIVNESAVTSGPIPEEVYNK